jgi:signal transduction histidine kinase
VLFWGALADDQGRPWSLDAPAGAILVSVGRDELAAALDANLCPVFAPTPVGTACSARVTGDRTAGHVVRELAAALDAILGNVFAHTPDGTAFSARVTADGTAAHVVIEDRGPGATMVLTARGMSGRGSSGLGVDIARRTAEASGGALAVERVAGGGTRVILTLGLCQP